MNVGEGSLSMKITRKRSQFWSLASDWAQELNEYQTFRTRTARATHDPLVFLTSKCAHQMSVLSASA